jgi:hypothetical protein
VVLDPQLGLAVNVFPCADGHARERSLLEAVADTVAPGEVWVADRNFCVSGFLHAIDRRAAFCIIRQHGGLTTKPSEPMRRVGSSDTGEVHEQAVQLDSPTGEHRSLRRITVTLKRKTRNDYIALVIPTHPPIAVVHATTIAACYRARRGIETAFQKPEHHLDSEIETLGYPPGPPCSRSARRWWRSNSMPWSSRRCAPLTPPGRSTRPSRSLTWPARSPPP